MKLAPIVLKLRTDETRFGNNIGGAAEMAIAMRNTLKDEIAFVVPIDEAVTKNSLDNGLSQVITEKFGVIVALNNAESSKDKTGLTAYDSLHDIREEIFDSLLGWQMDDYESVVSYAGGRLININPAQLWYMFQFTANYRITERVNVGDANLAYFEEIYAQYILAPSSKLPVSGVPYTGTVDMEQMIDKDDDPRIGDFDGGFGYGFKLYTGD